MVLQQRCRPNIVHGLHGHQTMVSNGRTDRWQIHIREWEVGLLQCKLAEVQHSDPPEMENLTGAASHGRKLQNSKGRALEASTVQYCNK